MEDLEDVKEELPNNANVSELKYEGSDIIIYTNSKNFFLNNSETVKQIVSKLKKRVEVRPSSRLFKEPENAEKEVKELVRDKAGLEEVIFQPNLGKMILRAKKPGQIIGKNGKGLDKIKEKTLWSPQVERVPAIKSKVVNRARELTVEDPEFRKDFLHDVGKKIRLDKSAGDEWIRISSLGGFRQVGRSCVLVQTEESNVLLDAGINPAAEPGSTENYPYLNAPELNLQDLDAVILSHAHMDHCLTPDTPITLADGTRKPIGEVEKGEKLKTVNWETGEVEEGECKAVKEVKDDSYLEIRTPYNNINASGDHKFFIYEELEVKEIEAEELEEGDHIPKNAIQRSQQSKIKLEKPDYRERLELTNSSKKQLKQIREEKGYSRPEVSEKLNKGTNFVYDLEERYNSIYKSNLEKLVDFYGLDLEKFLSKHNITKTEYPETLNEELAQLLGYFFGDGHKSEENRLRITDKNKECLSNYSQIIQDLFNYKPEIKPHSDKTKNAYNLEINNTGIIRFLENNFSGIYENQYNANIPNEIVYGSEEAAIGFIRGFFDAEGDVGQGIRFSQQNFEVRKKVQNILSSLGIEATVSQEIRVNISKKKDIALFNQKIGASHPKKEEKIEKLSELIEEDVKENRKLPVTNSDLQEILEDARMKGKVSGSPSYKNLPTCIVDWYRRNEKSTATEKTVETLVNVLENRINELEQANIEEIKATRQSLSITREKVAQSCSEVQKTQLQLIEDSGKEVEAQQQIEEHLKQEIETAIQKTRQNKQKLEKLLQMDVKWAEITSITEEDNEYGYLVDIKVDPNQNFLANDVVVHNCGMIPYLYKMGYDGPLYCTEPTRDLMIMLTLDYIGLAHSENNKAPYDSSAIKKAVKRTITPEYGEVTDITPDMRLTLRNSGHIIGSALTHLHIGEGLHNILYTGDYNYDNTEMLRSASTNFRRVETLITEATYGGRNDEQTPREESNKKFLSKMKQTLNKGGKVIVPAFAVGRSQEVLGLLADEMDRSYFDYNVYIDGMINDSNALHTAYPEFLSKKVQDKVFKEDDSPFLKENIEVIGSHRERKQVKEDDACVILTTSGMLTGGPVLSYLKEFADEEDNSLIFVGYQAEGTLGREILDGRDTVDIDGEKVDVNLDVTRVSGFSAHSDREQIINFCKNLRSKPRTIFTNHGEEKKCFSLASTLHKVLHVDTSAPQNLEVNRLN